MTAALKADLDVKICNALGSIGSEEALPALMEISKSKGFFKISAYPENVRNVADKAFSVITRKKPDLLRDVVRLTCTDCGHGSLLSLSCKRCCFQSGINTDHLYRGQLVVEKDLTFNRLFSYPA